MAVAPQVSYPGVYIQEVPSGVRTLVGVPTAITAFIGRAPRGPIDEPTLIGNYGEFDRTFGGLDFDHPLSYAVNDFFANGGSMAMIVRIYKPSQKRMKYVAASDLEESLSQADDLFAIKPAFDALKTWDQDREADAKIEAIVNAATNHAALLAAANDLKSDPTDVGKQDQVRAAGDAVINGAIQDLQTKVTKYKTLLPTVDTAFNDLKTTLSQAKVKAFKTSVTSATTANKQGSGAAAIPVVKDQFQIEASNPGTWMEGYTISIDTDGITDAVALNFGADKSDLFNIRVINTDNQVVESFANVSIKENAVRRLDRVLQQESSLIRVTMTGGKAQLGNSTPALTDANNPPKKLSGGVESEKLTVSTDFEGNENEQTGMYALEKADIFNILCIPPDGRSDSGRQNVPNEVFQAAAKFCERRRAFLIVDPQQEWGLVKPTAMAKAKEGLEKLQLTGPEARNAALYFPRVIKADPLLKGQPDTFAPCGIMAGIMARTDASRGVWKAPAGTEAALSGIQSLQVDLSDMENGQLNPLGINCLRSFRVYGTVAWGARTLRGADQMSDDYKYVPVRRLVLYIEESLYRGTQWAVFEPNDEPLWSQLRLNVGSFMHDLFRQGAFQGQSPNDSYFVRCDSTTTTQSDINKGIVNIMVGFAPLKPAEFVVIYIQQIAGNIET